MNKDDLLVKDVGTHFAFGKNWRNYAATIDEPRILSAMDKMRALLGRDSLEGLSFVDIGCGSGIHSLAALRLGARKLAAYDFDPISVETTRALLSANAPAGNWSCEVCSVFDLPASLARSFDVVYSWGVLHHTGDMWTAITRAAELTAPGAIFAVALYYKTPLCGLWKIEKRVYSKLPAPLQFPILAMYSGLDLLRLAVRGHNPISHVKNYQQKRGMNFWHDEHDWLGGYPYESASRQEVIDFMAKLGFSFVQAFRTESSLGITGTGCAEYLFKRN